MDNVKLDAIIARLCAVPVPETVPAQKPEGRPAPLCRLDKDEAIALAKRAKQVLLAQPMLLELEAPVNVVGDVHGQYVDLLRLFRFKGHPPAANYLFLGDYVDRGDFGLETVFLLLAYKCKYPENFFLLRGNHECASINRIYGFFDECKARYTTVKPYKAINDAFNCLPIAAVVGDKIFCVHGGLSPLVHKLDDICLVERPANVPEEGLLCDFLWADPGPLRGWADNDRGVSFTFGDDVIAGFLKKHKFDLVCRAHQVVEDGYEFFGANRDLVTLFSAPNYCGEFNNSAAIMSVDANLRCSFHILLPLEEELLPETRVEERRNSRGSFVRRNSGHLKAS